MANVVVWADIPVKDMARAREFYSKLRSGAVIYLSAPGDLDGMLERAVEAGATLHAPKQNFGEMGGGIAWIIETEGNLIGLQQPLEG